ncbi:hypothetical protein HNY73_011189 [Argiope bruennichi]|uniref:Peptidase aspartic putative domain-containing protein n=1 Tax=Argiope bruennichi TaxID=94029 RepID=A0A8T0F3B7_ARGBR|nr:hypothetical protein HNY73_011189 [Argiope bruennichi]
MVPESKAARLVYCFAITSENYSKAVQQLKTRFGREYLLVQIYVRDLLSLVMKNATVGRNSSDLASLYDMLETKLRALESLGRTKEKFADFLEPLVESCLPESVLRAWERSRVSEDNDDSSSQRSLEKLMCFVRHEVESEEMISLAREGFGKNNGVVKRNNNKNIVSDVPDVATAAMLVRTNASHDGIPKGKPNCVFCEKSHLSSDCFLAQKMSYDEKKQGKKGSWPIRRDSYTIREHGIYAIEINDFNGAFKLCSEVFSERKICGFAPKIENQHILENLRINKFELSDAFCNEDEIDLLLRADLIGKLLTGKCIQLNFGLAEIHAKLGWTVVGKETGLGSSNDEIIVDSFVQTVLSLYVNDIFLKELWEIDTLGIRDPIENVSKRKLFDK